MGSSSAASLAADVAATLGAAMRTIHHLAKLQKTGNEWKLTEFTEQ